MFRVKFTVDLCIYEIDTWSCGMRHTTICSMSRFQMGFVDVPVNIKHRWPVNDQLRHVEFLCRGEVTKIPLQSDTFEMSFREESVSII